MRQNFIAEIGDEDVGALVGLEELDLYDNKLKGVGSALDKMVDLKCVSYPFPHTVRSRLIRVMSVVCWIYHLTC